MHRLIWVVTLLVIAGAVAFWFGRGDAAAEPHALAAPEFGAAFDRHWRDGKAELAGYDLTYPRYGELRSGTAATIFVTEPSSKATRVKPEGPGGGDDDRFGVMKLNLVEDFPTGVYDYNLMTSTFVSTEPVLGRPAGTTAKVSFTSQEWCGHVYHHLLLDAATVRETWHSYFEGEADGQAELARPTAALEEDALFHWARGFAAPRLGPGEQRRVKLLRSLAVSRIMHVRVEWEDATLRRAAETKTLQVPAGEFEVQTLTVDIEPMTTTRPYGNREITTGRRTWTFHVESAPPHRIIHWKRSDGYEAELLGTTRAPYWQLHAAGDESLLESIGLTPRGQRMP